MKTWFCWLSLSLGLLFAPSFSAGEDYDDRPSQSVDRSLDWQSTSYDLNERVLEKQPWHLTGPSNIYGWALGILYD